ncbi:MAG: FHA domain-containing protein [Bradymonadales bacterium]|nr:FHA domain-containing protein [Bradymonadales bacterium]
MAKLIYTDAMGKPHRQVLGERLTIGRHPAQDIQLLDRVVSKEHACIERTANQYIITDRDSRNGTYVNGHRIEAPCRLSHNDEVTIGSTTFSFDDSEVADSLVERVTVHRPLDSAIFTRVKGGRDMVFQPENTVTDVDTLRADYEKLRIANELNQSLSMEFDLDRLLSKILDRAFAIFPCDRGVILIRDEHSGEFLPRSAKLRTDRTDQPEIRISETILKEVTERHEAILSGDAMVDKRFSGSHSIILEGIRATMTVPLLYVDKLLGIIHLDTKMATGAFSEKDLHLLSGFARQAAISLEHSYLVKRMHQEAISREKLGRLLPPYLVDQVLEGRIDISKGGNLQRATILFADIRGFTSMAERITATELVTMLNEYFEIMVEVIFAHGGTLDKFIGDEIMAIWGAPFTRPDDAQQAVATAIEMQRALDEFNDTRRQDGLVPIHVGCGLNTGEVVAGYMGSSRSMSYTVVGDVVNTARRVCSVAGPGEVIISAGTLGDLRGLAQVEPLPPTMVKGKREPIQLYRVLDFQG